MPERKISDEQALTGFVNNLVSEKGVSGINYTERGRLIVALKQKLNETMEQETVLALPDEALVKMGKLIDKGAADEEIAQVFEDAKLDFEGIAQRALARFREEYLTKMDDMAILAEENAKYQHFRETAPSGQGEEEDSEGMKVEQTEAAKTNINTEEA